ncbi:MAG: hypothetical protein C5B50_02040 [Verrucomicrobia bacterium]|nr:MAG: hypothetical protein C5B50_02040 [Verrucomicrobiota bacterium]
MLTHFSARADQLVTNMFDTGPGTLRQAILAARPGDTIRFDGRLVPQIVLTNGELIFSNLSIVGPALGDAPSGGLVISGNYSNRVFHFLGGTNALANLTIAGGYSTGVGGGILNEAATTLFLYQCNVLTNASAMAGGGLANFGNLILNSCTVAANAASTTGGGIYNYNSNATVRLTNSTLSANQSATGAGIYNYGGSLTLQNCTLAANVAAATGGGISSRDSPPVSATNLLASTLVAQNQATNSPDLDGSFISRGFNIIGAYTGGGNFDPTNQDLCGTLLSPVNPRLGPLTTNGGPTLTMALKSNSPAINQGFAGPLLTDQRGWSRKYNYTVHALPPGGDASDIGAFELTPPSPTLTIGCAGTTVVLSWPTNGYGFRLQIATALQPAYQWTDWPGPLQIMADQYIATDNYPTAAAKIFRLAASYPNTPGVPANLTTLAPTQVAPSSAFLLGSLVPGSSNLLCWFQYGTDTSYKQTSSPVSIPAGTNAVLVSSVINGLAPATLYHFRLVVAGGIGASFANDLSFTTPSLPTVTTLAPALVNSNSALLNATLNPLGAPATGWFVLYTINPPTNTVLSTQNLGNGTNTIRFGANVSGLTPGVTYYYFAAASNAFGTTCGNSLDLTVPLVSAPVTNLITAENALAGSTDWKLTNPVTGDYPTNASDLEWPTLRTHAIEGYASATSVNPGDWLSFYVSTTSPSFALEIFRMGYYAGLGGRRMPNASWFNLPGTDQPTPPVQSNGLIECVWAPTYLTAATNGSFQVPLDWVSGIYVAKLTASAGKQSYIVFVVRNDARSSPYLVQSSVTTYQAYNEWGGKSFYAGTGYTATGINTNSTALRSHVISFDRPYVTSFNPEAAHGNGAGQLFTWYTAKNSGSSQEPATWECNMVRWLEAQGYDVTYCTDIDVHRDPNLLLSHKAFIPMGHDEYWSGLQRTNVEQARDLGVHLGFFAGNTVWNMVSFDNDSRGNALRTMNYVINYVLLGWFPETLVGGTWAGSCDANLQIAPDCPAWLSDGTGLVSGSSLGCLAGYEINGFVNGPAENSAQLVPPATAVVFTGGSAKSVVYTARTSGATVFSAATVQWSWGLDSFTVDGVPPISPPRSSRVSAAAQRVTSNILRRFLDATRMAADLADGEYTMQSANAYPQWLLCDNQGASNGPVRIYGYPGWTTTHNQAVWIITRYTGDRLPCLGSYKAAPDQWYTIRNKQNGQTLIVGNGGVPGGPVMVVGDATGNWGAASDNLQMMWRIWHYTGNNENWYLFQNVASGQLLIAANNNPAGSSVVVFGDNGGWGETEENPQKMWILTPH